MAEQGKDEKPTQRRLNKAREDGNYPSAKEFVSALQFMIFLGLLGTGGARWFAGFQIELADGVGGDDGRDALIANGEHHLCQKPINLYFNDGAGQLVAAADA